MMINQLNIKLKVMANSKREPLTHLKGLKKLFYNFVTKSTEGYEYAGGFLTIATEGLLFKPHFLNFNRDAQFIKASDALSVENSQKFKKVITVTTTDNSYTFVVSNRKKALPLIEEMANS